MIDDADERFATFSALIARAKALPTHAHTRADADDELEWAEDAIAFVREFSEPEKWLAVDRMRQALGECMRRRHALKAQVWQLHGRIAELERRDRVAQAVDTGPVSEQNRRVLAELADDESTTIVSIMMRLSVHGALRRRAIEAGCSDATLCDQILAAALGC